MRERSWAPTGPYDPRRTLSVLRRGVGDPTFRTDPDGTAWRATRTPEGPATLRLPPGDPVRASAWGPGAEWALDRLPQLLGAEDRPEEFLAHHRSVAEAARRHAGLRLVRTGSVLEALIPSVLEQKVTTREAYRSWRRLVNRFGEPAPGPAGEGRTGMRVMPDRTGWLRVPSWEWHRAGVDSKRSDTVIRAVRAAPRLEQAADMALPEAIARLCLVPGVGPWTAAEVLQRSNGAPDAVTVGDYHLPGIVGHALAGERDADDARMLELLAPYEGQRYRATRYIVLTGLGPPRRGPRREAVDIGRW
ncbi:DNA-3-methyladenine glycosylase family protein [Streptomyces spiramenti]|uniref:DNA-3-methyladenine glycosylase II n=1 Tax=Streptomyces spiramenti TaxID=2720606 RepID=A0ABX1AP58_9ACTN|nr:DNA-3-methyladenine glycosylase 2 family protein [Streptomyces spiramenti]NJP68859.1 DNA-3-methyladenine glycosylase 2 family protein [Streptomyces spiramenti]